MTIELKDLEEKAREIARQIDRGINAADTPKKIGFVLMLFDFGEGGSMTYLSNGRRQDVLKALQEAIDVISHNRDNPPQRS